MQLFNYMICEVYRSHPWRHGYLADIRSPDCGFRTQLKTITRPGIRKVNAIPANTNKYEYIQINFHKTHKHSFQCLKYVELDCLMRHSWRRNMYLCMSFCIPGSMLRRNHFLAAFSYWGGNQWFESFCPYIIQGRKIINPSGGYPPDIHRRMISDLWPMSVERRFQLFQ